MANPEFMNVQEAAKMLNMSIRAVYGRIYRHQLPFRRLGGKILFVRSDLIRYLNELPGVSVEQALERVDDQAS